MIVAGPNGSGKSTLLGKLMLDGRLPDNYINPDEVVKQKPFCDMEPEEIKYKKAMEYCESLRNKLLNLGESFVFETVLSRFDKLEFLKKAKNEGYSVESIFVCTDSVELNKSRVELRITQGGHGVPEDKIESRYTRSLNNLLELYQSSDEMQIFDTTSGDGFKVMFIKDYKTQLVMKDSEKIVWINDYLIKFLDTNTYTVIP